MKKWILLTLAAMIFSLVPMVSDAAPGKAAGARHLRSKSSASTTHRQAKLAQKKKLKQKLKAKLKHRLAHHGKNSRRAA